MKGFINYIHEIITLLGNDLHKLPWLVILFLLASFIDLIGLGLIAPYISLVIQPDSFSEGRISEILKLLNIETGQKELLIWLSGLIIIIFLVKVLAALLVNNIIISFAQNQVIRMRSKLMKSFQNLPYSIYLQRNSAEYIHSVNSLTGSFQGVLQQLLKTVSEIIVALAIVCLLVWENAIAVGVLLLLIGSTLFIYDRFFRVRMKKYGLRQNEAGESMVKGIHEGLEGFKEIRILGQEDYFHRAVRRGAEEISFNERRYQLISIAPGYLLEATLVIFVVLLLLMGLYLETSTETMLGTLGLFGLAAIRLKPIANQFAGTLTAMHYQRDSVSRLYADLGELETIPERNYKISNSDEPFTYLKLSDVQFTYPKSKLPALQNLSLEIFRGESIGLIGTSGSGKTTLLDVLLGLLEPQSGSIEFNGRSILENLEIWHSKVAYLPQQVFLIDNTLKNNIALGEYEDQIDKICLKEAIRQARLNELVEQLPKGINSLIGERGVRLSGGQRQRIALARAFYYSRNVLVMDEATSALDDLTEKEIVEEIRHLKGKLTLIVIAHRLTTVKDCDRIYRLEEGEIVEEGTPQQVLSLTS